MADSGDGYVRAQSDNLPNIDAYMLMQFIASQECYNAAEIRGVKAESSMRKEYVDNAIGYVQLKRSKDVCTVKCQICPEHKVKNKNYNISLEINEKTEEILNVTCHDCAASLGGCKHALAFLMWIHQKSIEPSPTEVECYWKKPKLSGVGTSIKFITTKDFGSSSSCQAPGASMFLGQFLDKAREAKPESQLLKYFNEPNKLLTLSLHHLLLDFKKQAHRDFLEYSKNVMEMHLCRDAELATREQSESSIWHELRYGRITASKLYAAAHCKKANGIFVEQVIGASKLRPNWAMKRGSFLEKLVLRQLEQKLKRKCKPAGLLLSKDHPELGASPDAICEDFVIEIKCPSSTKTLKNYVTKNNKISAQYKAQVQLQMLLFEKPKGIFCVADPSFEKTNKIMIIHEDFDKNYILDIISKAKQFWQ